MQLTRKHDISVKAEHDTFAFADTGFLTISLWSTDSIYSHRFDKNSYNH